MPGDDTRIGNNLCPMISIDMKKQRVRVFRSTLHFIGNPDYILLLLNPYDFSLCITVSGEQDSHSFFVGKRDGKNKSSVELYSKTLVYFLHKLCPHWGETGRCRIPGKAIQELGIIWFSLKDAIMTDLMR